MPITVDDNFSFRADPYSAASDDNRFGLDDKDWNDVVNTVIAEAVGGGRDGMSAVAHVINNRAQESGKSLADVVRAPHQFAGFSSPGPAVIKAQQDPRIRAEAASIVANALKGGTPDQFKGVTNFAATGTSPAWAKAMQPVANIGGNTFYRAATPATEAPSGPRPTNMSMQLARSEPDSAVQAIDQSVDRGDAATEPAGLAKLAYTNQDAKRNLPVVPELETELRQSVTDVYGPGYRVEVMSGGQGPHSHGITGSRRHTTKTASDVWVVAPDGKRLSGDQLMPLAQHWLKSDIGSVGFPVNGKNSLHLDLLGGSTPASEPLEGKEGRFWFYGNPTGTERHELQAALDGRSPAKAPQSAKDHSVVVPDNYFTGEPAPAAQPATQVTESADPQIAANDHLDKMVTQLNEKDPGRYTTVDASEFDAWHKDWEKRQPNSLMKGLIGSLRNQNPDMLGKAMDALGVLTGNPTLGAMGAAVSRWGTTGSYKNLPKVDSIASIRHDSLGHFASDVADYAGYSLGQGLGSMIPGLVTGGAAAAVSANPVIGLMAGAAGPSYVLNLGDLYGSARDDKSIAGRVSDGKLSKQDVAKWSALGAVAMTALDVVSLENVTNIGKKEFKDAITKRILKGLAEGALVEGSTEGLQEVISQGVQAALGDDKAMSDRFTSVIDNAVAGMLTGGVVSAASAAPRHGSAAADNADDTEPEVAAPPAGPLTKAREHGERSVLTPGRTMVINDAVPGNVGELHGMRVTIAMDQSDLPAGRVRVVLPDGRTYPAPASPKVLVTPERFAQMYPAPDGGPAPDTAATADTSTEAPDTAAPRGAPTVGTSVTVKADGIAPFDATIDDYADGEALVHDGSGEVFQVPLSAISEGQAPTGPGGKEADRASSATTLTPPPAEAPAHVATGDEVVPSDVPAQAPTSTETKSTLPPKAQTSRIGDKIQEPPKAGQRVIVEGADGKRFGATIEGWTEAETGQEALVRNDQGASMQVPLDRLYTTNVSNADAAAADASSATRPQTAPTDTLRTVKDRDGNDRQVEFPDATHADLYELGRERALSKKLLGASALDLDRASPAEQSRLADALGVSLRAAGQLADDYRFRTLRAANRARSNLPLKLRKLNDTLLERFRAESKRQDRKAPEAASETDIGPVTPAATPAPQSENPQPAPAAVEALPVPNDTAAHAAATSPTNALPEPSHAQKEAGNYKVGRVRLGGLDISIENPEGSERKGRDRDGKDWSVTMKSHYGYFRGTVGPDKDHIDTFIKPGTETLGEQSPVFVVDQRNPQTGRFDEPKVMLGFDSEKAARAAYLANYMKGWKGIGDITETTVAGLKRWFANGDTTKPFAPKWFKSRARAEDFIKRKKLGNTHAIVANGPRHEVRLRAGETEAEAAAARKAIQDQVRAEAGADAADAAAERKHMALEPMPEGSRYPDAVPAADLEAINNPKRGRSGKSDARRYDRMGAAAAAAAQAISVAPDRNAFIDAVERFADNGTLLKMFRERLGAAQQGGGRDGIDYEAKPAGLAVRYTDQDGTPRRVTIKGRDLADALRRGIRQVQRRLQTEEEAATEYRAAQAEARADAEAPAEKERRTMASEPPLRYPDEVATEKPATPELDKQREAVEKAAAPFTDPIDVAMRAAEDPNPVLDQLDQLRQDSWQVDKALMKKYGVTRVDQLDDAPLTDAERHYVFHSDAPTDRARIDALRNMLEPVFNLGEATSELRLAAHNLPTNTDIESMSSLDKQAVGRLLFLGAQIEKLGGDGPSVVRHALEAEAGRYADPQDAEFMARDMLKRLAPFMNLEKPAAPVAAAPTAALPDNTAADRFANNKLFTSDKVAAARKRLKSKLGQLNSGIDPEVLVDGMTLAGAYIEAGLRDFSAYAKAMTGDFGDAIQPYLLSFWEGARNYPGLDTTGMTNAVDSARLHEQMTGKSAGGSVEAASKDGQDGHAEQLDRDGAAALERAPAEDVRPAAAERNAEPAAAGSGAPDLFGNEPARAGRGEPGRSVAGRQGEVPASPGRGRGDRTEPAGARDDAGTQHGTEPRGESAGGSELRDTGPGQGVDTAATPAQNQATDYTLSDSDEIGAGGAKAKFRNNVAAIEVLRKIEAANRPATRKEQTALAKWVGWGGLRTAFPREDGSVATGWDAEAKQLRALLSDEEYRAAESSTRNAHYTSPEVVNGIWNIARHLGFRGGQVLEPSVGAGNFVGLMPGDVRAGTKLTGVELDHITGGIARNLYPHANIKAPVGFQDFSLPDGYFDLAIGNPPFGSERVYDARRRNLNQFSVHNFFFAKSIDGLKPNGVLAMVITNRFLDGGSTAAREYIADRADLVGAIRLPNNAFLKNAGTEVTTDIVVLRKRANGEAQGDRSWVRTKDFVDKAGKTVPLNAYFIENPSMMLGEFGAFGTMYGPDEAALVAREGDDLSDLLARAIRRLPAEIMDGPGAETVPETVTVPDGVHEVAVESTFLSPESDVYVRTPDHLGDARAEKVEFPNATAKERVAGMIRVRDAFAKLRRAQIDETATDKKLAALRERLNKVYDAFVRKHGPVNLDANKRLFRDDPTWPQISALEEKFDKGVSATVAKRTGETARKPSAEKAAIFTRRTQSPYTRPQSAASAKDALAMVLAELGRVDTERMAALYGKSPHALIDELGPLLFRTPNGGYETADAYLSGNVKRKLDEARRAAGKDPDFRRNVAALEDVQPADIEPVDIDVKPGAPWVPAKHIADFIDHITEQAGSTATYSPANAKWSIKPSRATDSAQAQWGAERASVDSVVDAAINGRTITVYDHHPDDTSTVNQAATEAANDKVEKVKAEWRTWVWQDDARRTEMSRIYNDTFNTDVLRKFDGSHLSFPGKVGDDIVSLRPSQKNFVWRTLQTPTALADHVVGAGKTFAIVASVMEKRRTGQARKPILAVPNHLVGQWAADFIKLYPGAKVLATTKKDFEASNRKRLLARVATGDWDAVIVAHSSFGKIGVAPEYEQKFIEDQITDLEQSIDTLRQEDGKKSRNVAQLTKWRDNMVAKLKRLMDAGGKDDGLTFDELGIDALYVDEAHEFKNLGFSTSMQRVAGLGNTAGSQKAADLFIKTRNVLDRTGGHNIVFATGTPISNTMAEMYTMQRYLDGEALATLGVSHFDAWAKVFGDIVTDWELSPSGQYKLNSRFAKFVNMPELMQRYLSFADVVTNDDIKAQLAALGKKFPLPRVKGGKPQNITVERSPDQAGYIGTPKPQPDGTEQYAQDTLVWRAENLPKKAEKGSDNMLKVMSDARKAALDMRLIDPDYPDYRGSKVHVAADNMKRIYDAWHSQRGTQLVFIDLSTPNKARAREQAALDALIKAADAGDETAQKKLDAMSPDEFQALQGKFSVYDDLKAKLIARGIPASEIAFIHDANTEAQKEELFSRVRNGQVRLLFGSTPKMGAGTNVQNRLVALHHLDTPWRPSDLEQRDGRGIRQGNDLYAADPDGFELEVLRYATKNTLDARQWQTIEGKARFIQQLRKGDIKEREIEDVGGEAANAAEMKAAASGNPLILEEMDLRQKIRRLSGMQAEHDREQHRIKSRIAQLTREAAHIRGEMDDLRHDAALGADAAAAPFAATIGGKSFDKPRDMGAAIIATGRRMMMEGTGETPLGDYAGFRLTLETAPTAFHPKGLIVSIDGQQHHEAGINDVEAANPTGVGMRVTNVVRKLAEEPEVRARRLAEIDKQVPSLERQIGAWDQRGELEEMKAQHRDVLVKLQPKKPKQAEVAPKEAQPRIVQGADVTITTPDLQALRDILEKVGGLKNARIVENITLSDGARSWGIDGEMKAAGYYNPVSDMIALAADVADDRTSYHEAFHRLQMLYLTPEERQLLKDDAPRLRQIVRSDPAMRPFVDGMDQNELEAEAFAIYAHGRTRIKPFRTVRNAWDYMVDLVRRVHNYLDGREFDSARAIFRDAAAGEFVARGPVRPTRRENQSAPTPWRRTRAFNRWFGNSKVIADNGDPLVVYHGSASPKIDRFDPGKLGSNTDAGSSRLGFFFASNPAVASSYAHVFDVYADTRLGRALQKLTGGLYARVNETLWRPLGGSGRDNGSANVTPVHLRINNPYIVDFKGSTYRGRTYRDIIQQARSTGHDGVLLKNTFDPGDGPTGGVVTDVWVAFEPTQIKSVYNSGTFDPADARIMAQKAPDAEPRRLGIPAGSREVSRFRNDRRLKAHPDYAAAKAGDRDAALRLVSDVVDPEMAARARDFGPRVSFVAVNAIEASGANWIPGALAERLAVAAGAASERRIVQANRAYHTGAKAMERLANRARFSGPVTPGQKYVLVDDVTVMGSTLADLADHIRAGGGEVAGVATLVNRSRNDHIAPTPAVLRDVKRRFGDAIENELGLAPESLTASEAHYLRNFRDADALRDRIATAAIERERRLVSKGIREDADREARRDLDQADDDGVQPAIARGRGIVSEPVTRQKVGEELRGVLTDFNPTALALVPLNYFSELKRPNMSAVDDYLRIKRRMDTYRGDKHQAMDEIAQDWRRYISHSPGRAEQLARLMHETTLAVIDPTKTDRETTEKSGYAAFRKRFEDLPAKGQALYRKVRDAYKAQSKELDQILLDNLRKTQEVAARRADENFEREMKRIANSRMSEDARSVAEAEAKAEHSQRKLRSQWSSKARMTKMRHIFERTKAEAPYFPLARFGDYFVAVKDVDGSILSFSRRERAADMERLARDMRKAYPNHAVETGRMSNVNDNKQAMDPRMVAEIETILNGAGVDADVMDEIWQRYLETMPDLSTRKRFIHRKGTAGFDEDALRAFGSHMFHAAHQMARVKYGVDLQEMVHQTREQARIADDPTKGMALANELEKRHQWLLNPTGSRAVQNVTSAMFVWYLGATPAAAMVNLSQTVMLGIPILGARLGGVTRATAQIARASADFLRGRGGVQNANLNADEQQAMTEFYESGLVDRTQAHDLAGVGETGARYSPHRQHLMNMISWMFHKAEVANREITALAAYRLARARGQSHAQAVDTAMDLTWKTHFDYSNSSRARIMQGDAAKLLLVFQNYQLNMWYRLARDTHQALKGSTKAARHEARYQLAGIAGMMTLLAGVHGFFGYNLIMALLGTFLDDKDDPMGFKAEMDRHVFDLFGNDLGGMILNGAPGHLSGLDLTNRIGMPDFFVRAPDHGEEGRDWFEQLIIGAMGVVPSTAINMFDGFQLMKQGKVARGVEAIAPKAIKDMMQAYRYGNEGILTRGGDVTLDRDAVDAWDMISEVLGFTSAKVAETYERNGNLMDAERHVQDERRELMNRFALAWRMDDEDGKGRALEAIRAWNKRPYARTIPITSDSLKRSLRARERNRQKRQGGVLIQNEKLGAYLRSVEPQRVYADR